MCSSSGESIVSIRHLVYVTYTEWHIPDVVLIQFNLLMMSTWLTETCRKLKWTNKVQEFCVKLVIYRDYTEMYGQQNIKFLIIVSGRCSVDPNVPECEQKGYVTVKFPRTLPRTEPSICKFFSWRFMFRSSSHNQRNVIIPVSKPKLSAPMQCRNRIDAQITDGRSFHDGKLVAQ